MTASSPSGARRGSRFPIAWLLATTLLELAALPFHVAAFLVRRGTIRRRVRRLIEGGGEAGSGAADPSGAPS